jgi:glycerol-3-phosphate acyltransferase PlsX
MPQAKKIIAIDAFGGDYTPKAAFGGMNQYLFLNGESEIFFRIFGDEDRLRDLLKKYPRVARNSALIHARDIIKPTDKVAEVIRHATETSMFKAIKDVRAGESCAVVSAGNTGVLMALAKMGLKTIEGISRPAITTMMPCGDGDGRVVILDLGANIHCDESMLFDFAILGSVYAENVGGQARPKLGLLNIGEEDQKGLDALQKLNKMLNENKSKLPFEYIGFIEGNDIGGGAVHVVVTDGFTGNIVLKTVEGTAKLIKRVLMDTLKKSVLALVGMFFLMNVFKRLKYKIDPRSYAGAVFMGVNGFVVKTHGSSDALAFSNAIGYAVKMADADVNGKIRYHSEKLADIKKLLD